MPEDYTTWAVVTTCKYFSICLRPEVPGCKTRLFTVVSGSQRLPIAEIQYWPHWRQYVLCPRQGTVWSDGCLAEIVAFLRDLRASKVGAAKPSATEG